MQNDMEKMCNRGRTYEIFHASVCVPSYETSQELYLALLVVGAAVTPKIHLEFLDSDVIIVDMRHDIGNNICRRRSGPILREYIRIYEVLDEETYCLRSCS